MLCNEWRFINVRLPCSSSLYLNAACYNDRAITALKAYSFPWMCMSILDYRFWLHEASASLNKLLCCLSKCWGGLSKCLGLYRCALLAEWKQPSFYSQFAGFFAKQILCVHLHYIFPKNKKLFLVVLNACSSSRHNEMCEDYILLERSVSPNTKQ